MCHKTKQVKIIKVKDALTTDEEKKSGLTVTTFVMISLENVFPVNIITTLPSPEKYAFENIFIAKNDYPDARCNAAENKTLKWKPFMG